MIAEDGLQAIRFIGLPESVCVGVDGGRAALISACYACFAATLMSSDVSTAHHWSAGYHPMVSSAAEAKPPAVDLKPPAPRPAPPYGYSALLEVIDQIPANGDSRKNCWAIVLEWTQPASTRGTG